MRAEILRLFKGYLGEDSKDFNQEGLKFGLLIPNSADEIVVKEAIKQYGKDGEKWNQCFHKDFEIVRNAPIEDLIMQQLIHYMTTYGFEDLGIYDSERVYIPKEKLEIPELKENIELIAIKALTEVELTTKIMTLLTSGIALSEQTIKDIMILSDFIDKERFDEINNREIKTALYDKYNIMPRNPEDFLRYLLFKVTDNTLKIQNVKMIYAIKNGDKKVALNMLNSYLAKIPNGYDKLSSIFLRNKNLFLAFKIKEEQNEKIETKLARLEINHIINKLRKLAVKNHKPLSKNVLDCLTDINTTIDLTQLPTLLDKTTIFREIRILNGLLYRLNGNNAIVHKIRNGKSYVRTLNNKTSENMKRLENVIEIVKKHLYTRLEQKVKGKTICIPKDVVYAVPTSEKQFNGNFPEGSYIEVPRTDNLIYGVYWKNIANSKKSRNDSYYYGEEPSSNGEERVDLDLHQMNKNEIFGWDASYRSTNSDILFSGDMTDAKLPKGASELFYIGQNYGHGAFLITLNMFTCNSEDVPFEFVIAKATHKPNDRVYYALDPNNILAKFDMLLKTDERQAVVGFITIGDSVRFYFNDFSAGGDVNTPRGGSTAVQNEITMGAFDYLQSYSKTQLKLNELLKEAGAIIVEEPIIKSLEPISDIDNGYVKMVEKPVDLDLSTNVITKESIIKLLSE